MLSRPGVCLVVSLVALLSSLSVAADDGGLAFAEGCATDTETGFAFGPVVDEPFVQNDTATDLFSQIGDLYDLLTQHPYGNGALYFEIVYGAPSRLIVTNNGTFTPRDVETMTTLERSALAQSFFEQEGVWSEVEAFLVDYARLANRRSYGELAAYCEWRKAVIGYNGGQAANGILGYWDETEHGNPNAAAYRAALTESNVSQHDIPELLTSSWAFLAVAGLQLHVSLPVPLETNEYDPVNIANHLGG